MTWILQANHDTWVQQDPGSAGNPSTLGVISPIITVPYTTEPLFMDVTIYDQTIINPSHPGVQIQYYLKSVDTTNPGNLGSTTYESETDFYYQHHSSASPFTQATGVALRKNGGGWTMGDKFVMLWLFYEADPSMICGIKSIRLY